MAAKKDFSKLNTGRVYDAIAEATAEPEAQEVQPAQDEQRQRARPRPYTEAEKLAYKQAGKTQGRPGLKLERINLAFTPDNYEYVKTMASVRGQSMTEFVNHIIAQSMEENAALFAQAKAFKKAF
jgi:hypothetical protein